ncbi:ATP-binding cassette domain-containing protein, partial [Glutamicibacter creatinolyticus]|uniref:ATP-binding cassette domain-containing protein n=1 Tax=Glutamicibacter creatinolyticus TaxID=162496 RepID=UPI003B97E335
LQDLAAGYERNPQAIRAVNLSFPPGSRTAVIGASGSGKSTLLRVLSGQLETSAGIVHDARQALGPATLRLNTAVVEQQAALFAMSLRDNLLLADPGAEDEQLVRLLRQVGLGPWFDALDEGLDLQLGEAGARLS